MRKLLSVLLVSLTGLSGAQAQTSLADIQAAVAATSSELEQVDAMLADTDPNRRLAALQLLIASGHPVYMKRAKEVGLLSSDPEMRKVAVAATFDQGGPFRLEIDLSQIVGNEANMYSHINRRDGSVDVARQLGQITFSTSPYNHEKKCWTFRGNDNCAIIPTGAAYSLDDWYDAAGSLQLLADGSLRGPFTYNGSSNVAHAPARIPLAE